MNDDEFILVDVTDVRVLARYVLELTFDTGETRVIDVESWLTGPMFEPLLADYAMFKAVRVDADAGTIVWPNGADFSPSGLYVASKPVVPTRGARHDVLGSLWQQLVTAPGRQ